MNNVSFPSLVQLDLFDSVLYQIALNLDCTVAEIFDAPSKNNKESN